jgi:hypothetical protein
MAQATDDHIMVGPIRLSDLCRNPVLRDAFRRAERDQEDAYAVPAPSPDLLSGGAAAEPSNELGEVAVLEGDR